MVLVRRLPNDFFESNNFLSYLVKWLSVCLREQIYTFFFSIVWADKSRGLIRTSRINNSLEAYLIIHNEANTPLPNHLYPLYYSLFHVVFLINTNCAEHEHQSCEALTPFVRRVKYLIIYDQDESHLLLSKSYIVQNKMTLLD